MKNQLKLIACIGLPLALAACGGGGGDAAAPVLPTSSATTTVPAPASGDFTGSVSKLLDTNGVRGGMYSKGLSLVANATDLVQTANGAVTKFSANSLAGSYGVKEMHGDQWYAVGRWNKGTATVGFTQNLTLTDANAAHYLVYHPASSSYGTSLAGAKLSCADTHATKPSTDSTITSVAISNATVAVKANGTVDAAFTITADGSSGKVSKQFAGSALWANSAYAAVNLGLDGAAADSKNGSLMIGAHETNQIMAGGMFSLNGHPAVYSLVCKVAV
ncbi:hypothetical protein PQU95_14345 [Vogesella sp. DC21W]|uniref:Transferrin-binding protein B C-lobe/N-lobe beta barrel domain-containing protein n=1 Tax=Vogesella aquatica TaxID=2984206 RepID=A0ABT5J0M8_9NEIS|nr:hypothetical protein [Vogesella aquatica]MDC7718389.1 hypothetical protein [Vogesella aquatica]